MNTEKKDIKKRKKTKSSVRPEHHVSGHEPADHRHDAVHHESQKKLSWHKIKRTVRKIWRENKFECISVAVLLVAAAVALPFIIKSVRATSPASSASTQEVNLKDYGDLFSDSTDEGGNTTAKSGKVTTENGVRVRVDESTGEKVEDPTVLQEKKGTKAGYLDNCVFIGDSRTVAMVSYGVISDEDVLAKVGISHTAVKNYTFEQNSGKQYTVKSFLAAKSEPVIYIALGVNGMKGAKEEDYEKAFKDLVEYIMELGPDREIVLMAIWPVDDNGTYKGSVKNEWIDKYNDFLLALAEYEGIYYLDINTILKDKNGSIKKEYDGGDGLHYSASAYNVIIDYIISHPVPGISDDGEYVVHYVKPRGEFKQMIKKGDPIVTPVPEEVHEHNYYVSEITREATCTDPGLRIMACEGCDSIYEEEIPALGHDYGDDGKCKRCGAKNPDYAPEEQQQHVHDYHEDTDWSDRRSANCSEKGLRRMVCSCGDSYTEEIPTNDSHNFENGKCTRCGADDPNYTPPEPEQKQEETTPEPTQEPTQEPASNPEPAPEQSQEQNSETSNEGTAANP